MWPAIISSLCAGGLDPGLTCLGFADGNREAARQVLFEEAAAEKSGQPAPEEWTNRIQELSDACESSSRTHIAMLGTAILAKATDLKADAFSVKEGASTEGAYSARGLGHGVLVPNAPILGIHLGVTGREPLNNQPYFRVLRATEKELLPLVRGHAQKPVKILVAILKQVENIQSKVEARGALRAFISVRRKYQPKYPTAPEHPPLITPSQLVSLVERLVGEDSEGGKRAQAVVAGLMDAVAVSPRIVEMGRINDPDRHFAGDVGVFLQISADGTDRNGWERVFEVRDKSVTAEDVLLFAQKLARDGIRRGAVLAAATRQRAFDPIPAISWASENGVHLVVFIGWRAFIEQALFWCSDDAIETCAIAFDNIRERLIEVEASEAAVRLWDEK